MRLNNDAVRGVLMYLGENLNYLDSYDDVPHEHETMVMGVIANGAVTNYSENETLFNYEQAIYATEQLIKERYLQTAHMKEINGNIIFAQVSDITWKGQELLKSIENQDIWNAVQNESKKYGVTTLHALTTAAKQIGIATLTNPNAINNIIQAIQTAGGILK